jgi:hypothetical protein
MSFPPSTTTGSDNSHLAHHCSTVEQRHTD